MSSALLLLFHYFEININEMGRVIEVTKIVKPFISYMEYSLWLSEHKHNIFAVDVGQHCW